MPHRLLALQRLQRLGTGAGIGSVCSAHPLVLRAVLGTARDERRPALIEATCNQVNQEGGYTGMTPGNFVRFVHDLARQEGLPEADVILGGDHLGPTPWLREPAEAAMTKARAMVDAYVRSGFRKLHLDASARCADDPDPLPEAWVAARTAALASAAEEAFRSRAEGPPPVYVIGTEVPIPGGLGACETGLHATSPEALARTLDITEAAFREAGLDAAWERVVAIVVQPGVEFGEAHVHPYDASAARPLRDAIAARPPWMFEAHSTDYQRPAALRQLVEDRFSILKVGPWLTFACREALFALESLAEDLRRADPARPRIRLREILEGAMTANPIHWRGHHAGPPEAQALARLFSLSDRSRYYWPHPEVAAEVERLLEATDRPLPPTLISQHFPMALEAVQDGALVPEGRALIDYAVRRILAHYSAACQPSSQGSP